MKSIKPDAWHAAALEFGKLNDTFVALSPRANPVSWQAWRNYFRWMNWAPYWFVQVEREHAEYPEQSNKTWTAPIDHPDKFTVRFEPAKTSTPVFPLENVRDPRDYQLTAPERAAVIDKLRAAGKLAFDHERHQREVPWLEQLSKSAAEETLERYRREAGGEPVGASPVRLNEEGDSDLPF